MTQQASPVTGPEMLAAIERVVAKRGSTYKYPGRGTCHYRWTDTDVRQFGGGDHHPEVVKGEPACLIGMALDDLGLLPLVPWSDNSRLVETLDLPLTEEAKRLAGNAQYKSDSRVPWGAVLSWVKP